MDKDELIRLALEARDMSYSPYSNFRVGAALLTESGNIYQGANVENSSYGASICAERTAALKAITAGDRSFTAIAIAGFVNGAADDEKVFAYPCGICRQFLSEFAASGMKVYVAKSQSDFKESTLTEMLPYSFGPKDLL